MRGWLCAKGNGHPPGHRVPCPCGHRMSKVELLRSLAQLIPVHFIPKSGHQPARTPAHRPNALQGIRMTITAINVRNQFRGKVREIIEGPVVSEVDVETSAGLIVTSVITTRSVKELGLVVGKDVVALVKATEVSIATL
jgi:molybdopterin-binding protein